MLLGQDELAVIPHSMSERVQPGEDRRMRRGCQGNRRVGLGKAYTLGGQPIDVGRGCSLMTVAPDVIGAGGVKGHEQHVPLRLFPTSSRQQPNGQEHDRARLLRLQWSVPLYCQGRGRRRWIELDRWRDADFCI